MPSAKARRSTYAAARGEVEGPPLEAPETLGQHEGVNVRVGREAIHLEVVDVITPFERTSGIAALLRNRSRILP